jgi:hypothetical protein
VKVKKIKTKPEDKLNHILSNDVLEIGNKERINIFKQELFLAKHVALDYADYIKEMQDYTVEIPRNPDIKSSSDITETYAKAQSYYSRATAIGMLATDNASRWKRIQTALEEYIENKEAKLWTRDEISELRNLRIQQAEVRKRLLREYRKLSEVKLAAEEAQSFYRIVESKKKDLQLVMTTLGKQVKALALEQEYYKK